MRDYPPKDRERERERNGQRWTETNKLSMGTLKVGVAQQAPLNPQESQRESMITIIILKWPVIVSFAAG